MKDKKVKYYCLEITETDCFGDSTSEYEYLALTKKQYKQFKRDVELIFEMLGLSYDGHTTWELKECREEEYKIYKNTLDDLNSL